MQRDLCSFSQLCPSHTSLHHNELQLLIAIVQSSGKYPEILHAVLLPLVLFLVPEQAVVDECFPCRYSVTRPVETHMSGSSKNLTSQAKVSAVLLLSLLKLAKF